jgi:hypothetical protein
VTRALLGGSGVSGKYTEAQTMRFLREGARRFLRLDQDHQSEMLLFGDCGAFSYHTMEHPPFKPPDMIEFYQSGQFTHGVSIDHIVFEFGNDAEGSAQAHHRTAMTLELAESFLQEHRRQQASFTPVGAVQGWSPESLGRSAAALVEMGYRYLAIGGLVPLRISAIQKAVSAVDEATAHCPDVKIHLLGFAKAEHIHLFRRTKVASFDSTSPLIRAFKDNAKNYWATRSDGHLDFYAAIRVPQVNENNKLRNQIKRGLVRQERLKDSETSALKALRQFDGGRLSVDETVDRVIEYSKFLIEADSPTVAQREKKEAGLRESYRRTLEEKPWKRCDCKICRDCGVEVVIFRASNRNKRRGMHNLQCFHNYVGRLNQEAA